MQNSAKTQRDTYQGYALVIGSMVLAGVTPGPHLGILILELCMENIFEESAIAQPKHETREDFIGQPLKLGDRVIYIGGYYKDLKIGRVTKFCPQMIEVTRTDSKLTNRIYTAQCVKHPRQEDKT
jgi:hypothetical protein